jgi:hypothetical protein
MKSLNCIVHVTINYKHKAIYITCVIHILHYTVPGQSSSIKGLH